MPVTYPYARPQTAVDVLLFTVGDFWEHAGERPRLEIALIRREQEPFAGERALPGTILRIEPDEEGAVDRTDLDAARRVLRSKLGIEVPHLEQLYTWFTRDADPRGPTTVVAWFAVVPFDRLREASRRLVEFAPVDRLPRLAFNHRDIVEKGVERVRAKASYSSLPALLMPACFTLSELQLMYEAVLGRAFDATNFARLVGKLGMIEQVPEGSAEERETRARAMPGQIGRPAKVYRLTRDKLVTFPRSTFLTRVEA